MKAKQKNYDFGPKMASQFAPRSAGTRFSYLADFALVFPIWEVSGELGRALPSSDASFTLSNQHKRVAVPMKSFY
jgi:hypothetical protein